MGHLWSLSVLRMEWNKFLIPLFNQTLKMFSIDIELKLSYSYFGVLFDFTGFYLNRLYSIFGYIQYKYLFVTVC